MARYARIPLVLSAVGFLLSFVSHVCALIGRPGPLGEFSWLLHIGIFVVWLPAVLAGQVLAHQTPPADLWKTVLRGCPAWMKAVAPALFFYAFINFFVSFADSPETDPAPGPMPAGVVRGFSGHWMLFYGLAFAILYSFIRIKVALPPSRMCSYGHPVHESSSVCEQCGASASHNTVRA